MRMQGTLLLVQSERRGSSLRSWSGTVLTVDSGADFADEGGSFTVAEDPTVYTYTGVTRSDVDESAVLLGVPSRTVGVGFVGVHPPQVDVWAEVEVAGAAGAVQAVVPHSLRPLLADGTHGPSVTIERVGEVWQVADVHGEKAEVQEGGIAPGAVSLANLDGDTQVQIGTALGKNLNTHAATGPTVDGDADGDLWWRWDAGKLVGWWRWDGSEWQTMELTSTVIPALDAGVIQSGVLQGIDIASPSLDAVPRVQIGDAVVRVIREDTQGEYVAAEFGAGASMPDPTAPWRVAVIGDSISEGTGASNLNNRWMAKAQQIVNARLGRAAGAAFPHIPAWYRTTLTAGQSVTSAGNVTQNNGYGFGWRSLQLTSSGASVTFTFTGTSADLMFFVASGTGKASVVVDGKPAVVVDTNASVVATATSWRWPVPGITGSGNHTVVVSYAATSTLPIYLQGLLTWNGDETAGARFYDGSHHGWLYASTLSGSTRMSQMTGTTARIDPDWVVLALGMNDITANNPASFQTNVQAHLTALDISPARRILLVIPYRSSSHTVAQHAAHADILRALAAANDRVGVLDLSALMPVATTAPEGQGLYADALHPNDAGHQRIGELVADALINLGPTVRRLVRIDGSDNIFTGAMRTSTPGGGPGVIIQNSSSASNLPGIWLSTDGFPKGSDSALFVDASNRLYIRGGNSTPPIMQNGLHVADRLTMGGPDAGAEHFWATTNSTEGYTDIRTTGGPGNTKTGFQVTQWHNDGEALMYINYITSAALGGSLKLGGGGNVQFPSVPDTTLSANLLVDANKTLHRSTSVRAAKINVQHLADEVDREAILRVPARIWSDRAEVKARRDGGQSAAAPHSRIPGVVAEEVEAAGLGQFLTRDADGKPDGVMYDRLWTALLPVVQQQAEQIAAQRKQIDALTKRLDAIESKETP